MRNTRMRTTMKVGLLALVLPFLSLVPGRAQQSLFGSMGGWASLSVTTSSSQVAIPTTNVRSFPSLVLFPAKGTTVEVFFQLGSSSSVVATTSSTPLPSGGMCLNNVGNATNIAAIAATGTATLRMIQVPTCPTFPAGG